MTKSTDQKRRFRYRAAMSLDGFIADQDGGVGWLNAIPDVEDGMTKFFTEIDTVVMGRKTLEDAMKLPWPASENRTIVLSSGRIASLPPGVETSNDAAGLIKELRAAKGRDIWVMGGGITAQTFLNNGALDEITVSIMPVLLRAGIPLFRGSISLKLIESKPFSNGVVRATYEPA
jgi:dihydrofolate reductase